MLADARDTVHSFEEKREQKAFAVDALALHEVLMLKRSPSMTAMEGASSTGTAAARIRGTSEQNMESSSQRTFDSPPVQPVRLKQPRSGAVKLDVLRINVLQVLHIDHIGQRFSARLFFQLRIPNGAEDEDMLRDLDDEAPIFPKDTLRPGARWLSQQVDFPTAHEFRILENKVVVMEPHIDIVLKVSGTFPECMELERFPVDTQELTIFLSISVANEGICPVEFRNLRDGSRRDDAVPAPVVTVNDTAFSMSNMWELSAHARLATRYLQAMEHTSYPSIAVTAWAGRRQGYYIFNVILPLGALQFLAVFQFLLPGDFIKVTDRISFSVTLLLTSAAYKLYVSESLPDISYLTLIDKYVLGNFFCQIAMILPSAILGFFRRGEPLPVASLACLAPCESESSFLTSGEVADLALMVCFFVVFVALHAWIFSRYRVLRKVKRAEKEKHETAAIEGKPGADTKPTNGHGFVLCNDSMRRAATLNRAATQYRTSMRMQVLAASTAECAMPSALAGSGDVRVETTCTTTSTSTSDKGPWTMRYAAECSEEHTLQESMAA